MIRNKIAWLVISVIATASNVCAQQKDAGLWVGSSFSFELAEVFLSNNKALKNWNFYAAPELRLDENMTRVNGFFSDFGTSKKWNKYIATTIENRIGGKRSQGEYNFRKRWSYGLQLILPSKQFKLSSTTRYQSTTTYGTDIDLKAAWREKFTFEFSGLKNVNVQLSHELFFEPITYTYTDWRSQINLKFKINKTSNFSVGYLIQKDLGNGDMDFVVLSGYKWELNRKKKKAESNSPK